MARPDQARLDAWSSFLEGLVSQFVLRRSVCGLIAFVTIDAAGRSSTASDVVCLHVLQLLVLLRKLAYLHSRVLI